MLNYSYIGDKSSVNTSTRRPIKVQFLNVGRYIDYNYNYCIILYVILIALNYFITDVTVTNYFAT